MASNGRASSLISFPPKIQFRNDIRIQPNRIKINLAITWTNTVTSFLSHWNISFSSIKHQDKRKEEHRKQIRYDESLTTTKTDGMTRFTLRCQHPGPAQTMSWPAVVDILASAPINERKTLFGSDLVYGGIVCQLANPNWFERKTGFTHARHQLDFRPLFSWSSSLSLTGGHKQMNWTSRDLIPGTRYSGNGSDYFKKENRPVFFSLCCCCWKNSRWEREVLWVGRLLLLPPSYCCWQVLNRLNLLGIVQVGKPHCLMTRRSFLFFCCPWRIAFPYDTSRFNIQLPKFETLGRPLTETNKKQEKQKKKTWLTDKTLWGGSVSWFRCTAVECQMRWKSNHHITAPYHA